MTQMGVMSGGICVALCGDVKVEWRHVPAANDAGGILCLWGEGNLMYEILGQMLVSFFCKAIGKGSKRSLISLIFIHHAQ